VELSELMLHKLFGKIWESACRMERGIPNQTKKKDDRSDCSNFRSIPGKLSSRVVLNRMIDVVDPKLRDQQAGFQKDRSYIDQTAT
jgi:hypothetical protein